MVTAIVTWALIGLSAALQVLYIIMYRKRSHTDHELLARVDHKMDALNARTDELSAKTEKSPNAECCSVNQQILY